MWIGSGCCLLAAQTYTGSLPAQPTSGSSSTTATVQTVLGQVVSATTGLPVFRALVRLNDRAVLTDHEGKFEFPQFGPASTNTLHVTKPGFYSSADSTQSGDLSLRADQLAEPIELRLYPEALLTGTVSRPDGTPLPHISVSARRSIYDERSHRWRLVGQTQTDTHGNFRLTVPPGDYRLQTGYNPHNGNVSEAVLPLSVPSGGESSTSDFIRLASGSQENFDLHAVLSRTYSVAIQIDSGTERGFPMITARSSNGLAFPVNGFGRPAAPGEMRIELPSGTYTLSASQNFQDTTRYGEATVSVTDHDVSGVVLHLAQVSPIPVELAVDSDSTSDKTPPSVQQLGLMLESTQTEGAMLGLMTVRDLGTVFHALPGTYHLQAHATGAWYVKSASYGTTDLLDKDLTISAGAGGDTIRVTVSDQTGSLQGTTSLNGALSPCWVYLMPTGPSATMVYSARSGSDGSFNFANLPPGSYRAISFEQRHSANYRDPKAFDSYATYLGSVTISTGAKASLDLNAVPLKEIAP